MKAFKKFCLLSILPLVVIAVISIIVSGSFNDVQIWRINIFMTGFFGLISLVYVYIFEKRQQKKEETVRNLLLSVILLFISVFCFALLVSKLFLNSYTIQISSLQALIAICIFFAEFLVFSLLDYSSKINELLVFNEKPLYYIKLVLGVSLIESIITMTIVISAYDNLFHFFDYFHLNKLIVFFFKIEWHCLKISVVSLALIWGLTHFTMVKRNYLFIVMIATLLTLPISLQLPVSNNHFLTVVFNASIFSASVMMVILLYTNKLKSNEFKVKTLINSFSKKEAEYLQLKNQVNPHFLFNNLNTLISFIEINPKKAVEFGHHLSNTYRHYLKNQNDDFVLLKEELEFIKEYLEIYKAKFENGFSFEISALPKENEYMLSLSLQEIVDNVFKHNKMDEESPLEIRISTGDDSLLIENSVSNRFNKQSNQIGLENINKRYKILTNKEIQIVSTSSMHQVSLPILTLES